MRIDAHQHFWSYSPDEYGWIDDSMAVLRRDFLPQDLAGELAAAGFDRSITVQARQTLEETRWLLELASETPSIAGVVGWVDLQSLELRSQLKEFSANPKLLGIRHIVQSEPDDEFLLRPEFLRGVSLLEEFGLSYDILIYPKHLPVAAKFVRHFPRQRFVLDHMAKPPIKSKELQPWKDDIGEVAACPNVLCKVSGMVTEADWRNWKPEHLIPYLDVVFDCFGSDRLMIGSDWPVCAVAASYSATMNVVVNYLEKRPLAARRAVLGGNAQRFWKLL
jgi:L-fuconolactonase